MVLGISKEEFDNLTNDGKYAPIYNNNNMRLGVGYGLTDTIKLTIIPSFKVVRSDKSICRTTTVYRNSSIKNHWENKYERQNKYEWLNLFPCWCYSYRINLID